MNDSLFCVFGQIIALSEVGKVMKYWPKNAIILSNWINSRLKLSKRMWKVVSDKTYV